MTSYDFIFSNKLQYRLYRHIAFWLAFSIHFFIQNLIIGKTKEALNPRTPLEALINIAYFLPVYIVSVYFFIDFVIPRFLVNRRYALFFILSTGLVLFNFTSCYAAGVLYEHTEWKMPYNQITFASNKYHAIVNGGFVSVMILGIAGGIKLSKKWLQKQRENEALAQQKIISELQLLKIQINPRFLFHSLHTVKQQILLDSPTAPQLILQVSDLLSYILYESGQEYVLLEQELSIIKDYLTLEEKSSENVQMHISITGDADGKYVTPLILLSIVEAGFEYFLENHQHKFSSELLVDVQDNQLDVSIVYKTSNDDYPDLVELNKKFEGIRKQLNNLYLHNHDFNIASKPGSTTIVLRQLPLRNDKPIQEELTATPNVIYENV